MHMNILPFTHKSTLYTQARNKPATVVDDDNDDAAGLPSSKRDVSYTHIYKRIYSVVNTP